MNGQQTINNEHNVIIQQLEKENHRVLEAYTKNPRVTIMDIYNQAKYLHSPKYEQMFIKFTTFCLENGNENINLVREVFNAIPNCKEEWVCSKTNTDGNGDKITTYRNNDDYQFAHVLHSMNPGDFHYKEINNFV
jgi:hypothetical protein